MARYAYDVNTRTRLIDVHKQFNGGLKTIDTDDALGSVYLRQAENVSLSEFGFIEKRYGTFEKDKIKSTGLTVDSKLQGYWEFGGFAIYAINNIFYYRDSAGTESPVTSIAEENADYRYPTLPTYDSSTGFGGNTFRDMNAVNINSVLYIFTGHYPVYVKIVNNVPTFYWFSVTVPSYDEIVVTGHNLLEDNAEKVYGYTTPNDYQTASSSINLSSGASPTITDSNYYPRIPFVRDTEADEDGSLNFEFEANFANDIVNWNPLSNLAFREIALTKIEYRRHGTGALGYGDEANIDDTDYVPINNWQASGTYPADYELSYAKNDIVTPEQLPENQRSFTVTNPQGATVLRNPDPQNNAQTFTYDTTTYKIHHTFTVRKEDLINNKDLGVRVLKANEESSIFTAFDLTNFNLDVDTSATFADGTSITLASNWSPVLAAENIITIQAVDGSGLAIGSPVNALGVSVDANSGAIKFKVPFSIINSSSAAEYYQVNFTQTARERQTSPYTYLGPTDLETTTDEYYFALTVMGSKSPAPSGRLMTQTFVPKLRFGLTNLLTGNWDFRVTFELTEFNNSSGGLAYIGSKFFSTELKNISITPEKLQDIPGQTDVLPKAKPIWSCNKVMEHYGKLLVWGSEDETNGMPTAVFYSFPDRPTYFPSKFYLDFTNGNSQPIEAVTPYMNILVAQTASQTWGIRGNSGLIDAPAPYVPFGINGTVGTIAYKSVRPVRNHLFFLSKQGVIALKSLYAADEQYNIDFVDRNIRNIVPQDSKAVGIQFDNQYWLNFPENSITLRWYIDKKAWVKDVYQGWVDKKFNGVFKYQIVNGKLEFITHPSIELEDETIYRIHKIGVDYDLPTDLTEGIKSKFETSFLNQNYPFHPKNYKEAKLDFTLQNEYNKSQGFIYEMDYDEDLDSTTVHTIDDAVIIPNHYYRIKYNFEPHEPPVLDAGGFENDYEDEIDGGPPSTASVCSTGAPHHNTQSLCEQANGTWLEEGTFGSQPSNILTGLLKNDDYDNTFDHLTISNVVVRSYNNPNVTVPVNKLDYTTTPGEVTFQVPNFVEGNKIDVEVTGDFTNYTNGADITNITYDDALTLNAWVVSEDQTLNLDNIDSYDQAKAGVDFNFNTRLGTWVFGSSDFGNKVTAVKTIKLSGKGYNAKVYIEDDSKSKWTLESLGLTYKMKRARSR